MSGKEAIGYYVFGLHWVAMLSSMGDHVHPFQGFVECAVLPLVWWPQLRH